MTIFKKDTVVETFPAFDIVTREVQTYGEAKDAINISAGDLLTVDGLTNYTAGSAVSYALANNDDPIKSYNQEKERGHPTHWLSQNATVLTSHKQARKVLVKVEVGTAVYFEGRLFEIIAEANNNLGLATLTII
jgi:hypothetical protein